MSTIVEREPTVASEEEYESLRLIERMLASDRIDAALRLVGADGVEVPLPTSLQHILRQLTHALARKRPVAVIEFSRELTTQEAADILNVSRPFLVKQLLDTGQIPFTMTGTHRRIAFDDLMAYKQRRDQGRRQTLRELAQASQQMGLD